MGWISFRAIRPNGEEFAVIFPSLADRYDIGTTWYTMSSLLTKFPDFPIEAHLFTAQSDAWKKLGFNNIIDVTIYAGETWTLDNGSTIVFGDDGETAGSNRYSIKFFTPTKIPAGATNVTESGAFGVVHVPNPDLGGGSSGYFNYGQTLSDRFQYPLRYLPETINLQRYGAFFKDLIPLVESTDPYKPGGETEPGGGEGDFDDTSDPIEIPPLPTASAVDAGFITLFNPSLAELNNLARYMWSDLFSIDGWKKIFADPMQAILGLSIVPIDVPSTGARPVIVGNISTDVIMTVASSQYVAVDCGTLNVNEFWGAYLDYDPYTKAEIYLPYIGTHALATDDIMNKSVHVVYHVDILSGACCAFVKCGDSVLYTFNGQCASSIPITGDNWTNVINGAITIAGAIGTMVATGGMSAPMGVGQIASASVNTLKPSIEKSGSMGGTGGLMAIQTPYLILTRPRQAVPKNQNEFIGYPAYITENLSDLAGYTEIESIHLENVPATSNELSEIESLLKSGVIF